MMQRALFAAVMAAFACPALGETVVILDATPPGGPVAPGDRIFWQISVRADPDDNFGLGAITVDLVTDLPLLAPGFALPPAVEDADGLPSNFATSRNFGTPILRDGLATLQTIGGAQDTVDSIASTFDAGPPLGIVPVPFGTVIEGVGQGPEPQVVAVGSFEVPADAAEGDFFLRTGGVPGNPGQTKLNLLESVNETTRNGTDERWSVRLLSPAPQEGVLDFTVTSAGSGGSGGGAGGGGGAGDAGGGFGLDEDGDPEPGQEPDEDDDPADDPTDGDDGAEPADVDPVAPDPDAGSGTPDDGTDGTQSSSDTTDAPAAGDTMEMPIVTPLFSLCGFGAEAFLLMASAGLMLLRFGGRRGV